MAPPKSCNASPNAEPTAWGSFLKTPQPASGNLQMCPLNMMELNPWTGFKKKNSNVSNWKKWHASNQKAWKSIEVPLCKSSHYVTVSSVDLRQATPRHLFPELTLGQVLWNHIKELSSQVMKQSKAAGNSILWASKLAKQSHVVCGIINGNTQVHQNTLFSAQMHGVQTALSGSMRLLKTYMTFVIRE